jgi:hypothetical protein
MDEFNKCSVELCDNKAAYCHPMDLSFYCRRHKDEGMIFYNQDDSPQDVLMKWINNDIEDYKRLCLKLKKINDMYPLPDLTRFSFTEHENEIELHTDYNPTSFNVMVEKSKYPSIDIENFCNLFIERNNYDHIEIEEDNNYYHLNINF